MSFHATHRLGTMEQIAPSAFPNLLAELDDDPNDKEHNSVSITHESEWCLSVFRGGYVSFENLEDGEPRHMHGVASEQIISLWCHLAEGNFAELEREPWQSGY